MIFLEYIFFVICGPYISNCIDACNLYLLYVSVQSHWQNSSNKGGGGFDVTVEILKKVENMSITLKIAKQN